MIITDTSVVIGITVPLIVDSIHHISTPDYFTEREWIQFKYASIFTGLIIILFWIIGIILTPNIMLGMFFISLSIAMAILYLLSTLGIVGLIIHRS